MRTLFTLAFTATMALTSMAGPLSFRHQISAEAVPAGTITGSGTPTSHTRTLARTTAV